VIKAGCTAGTFPFQAVARRAVQARFDGGLLAQFAMGFHDVRDPVRITHPVSTLVRERVYGLALGSEDLNDHDQLRPRGASRRARIGRTTARHGRVGWSPKPSSSRTARQAPPECVRPQRPLTCPDFFPAVLPFVRYSG